MSSELPDNENDGRPIMVRVEEVSDKDFATAMHTLYGKPGTRRTYTFENRDGTLFILPHQD